MEKDLLYFIQKVLELDSFWKTNYYMRCMKKMPHGGIGRVLSPNYYLKQRPADTLELFCHNNEEVPIFFRPLVDDIFLLWNECSVDIEELLKLCFANKRFWYAGFRVLKPKKDKQKDYPVLWDVVSYNLRFQDYFEMDNIELILYAFACYLIQENMLTINSIDEIVKHEQLLAGHNKYGLNRLDEVNYGRQGFTLNGMYYLYNLFIDTSIGRWVSEVPLTLEILQMIPNPQIYMRCDNILAVPEGQQVYTATVDFQKFRGITLVWSDIENLVFEKELVVHFHQETLNKLLLIIKKDTEPDGTYCYHIEVEELWNPDKVHDDITVVNYIHAKYLPGAKAFNHIDFSVNQYKTEIYRLKYNDAVNDSNVPIDKYADTHYKVWCVESDKIEVGVWSALVSATLDEPFRELFYEMFPSAIETYSILNKS